MSKGKLKNDFGEIWGYVRVSTKEQHTDRQEIALEEYGVDPTHMFVDKISGKNFNRPAYKKLLRIVRKGDVIVIKSLDRLGRNYQEMIDQWRLITRDIGCGIHVVDMPILNTSGDPDDLYSQFITDMMIQVLSFVAQTERENTITRQREGIEAAKRRRKIKIGRPKKPMPFDFWEIFIMWKSKEYKTNDLWRYCHETWGLSNRTFYRRLNEIDQRYGDIPVNRLRDLVLDEEMMEGIQFDNERIEQGIGYYNPYCLHTPEKQRKCVEKAHEKKRLEEEGLLDDEMEKKITEAILKQRSREFKDKFGIVDEEEPLPTELIYRHKSTNPGAFGNVVHKHAKNSGMNQAVLLQDNTPKIPNVDDHLDMQKPMKTIIVI